MLRKAIFVLIIIVLTLNFAFNIFDIADQKWFEIGCASSDNLVIMKIIRLAQNPFDLESTFMAFIGHEYSPDLYVAYMDGTRSLGELSENNYFSSLGFQGLFYGLIACLFFLDRHRYCEYNIVSYQLTFAGYCVDTTDFLDIKGVW